MTNTTALPAPLWRRFAAMGYDSFLVLAISMAYGALTLAVYVAIFGHKSQDYSPMMQGLAFQMGWIFSVAVFFIYFWARGGQTAGMKAWRIRVVNQNQSSIGITTSSKRFLLACVSLLALGLGFFWSIFDPQKQCLHDKLCQTNMIYIPKVKK